MPTSWLEALTMFRNGTLSGDDLILYADQCAPRMSDTARRIVSSEIH